MNRKKTYGLLGAVAALSVALVGCSGNAGSAQNDSGGADNTGADGSGDPKVSLQFASWLGPTQPEAKALAWAFEQIEERSGGSISIEEYWEGALLSGTETLAGTGDGRADLGHMAVLYNPAELPLSQLAAVPFMSENPDGTREAYTKLYQEDEAFRAEWAAAGVIPLSFQGTPPSIMGTTKQVQSIDDLKGMSIRAVGFTANAVEMIGANAAALTSPEIYEAMQRGLIEGYTTQLLDTIPTQSLHELTGYVSDPGIGVYSINTLIVGEAAWARLSENQQKLMREVIADVPGKHKEFLAPAEDAACEALKNEGAEVSVWSDAEKRRWKDAVGDELLDLWRTNVSKAGVEPEAFLDSYLSTLKASTGKYDSGVARCVASR